MKILLIGSGAREHAIAWKLKKDSPDCALYIAPGNFGTSTLGENVPIAVLEIHKLLEWAEKNRPDFTLVGPEIPLCAGVVDLFESKGLKIFGPNKKAAQLEGSKVFTKNLLKKYQLPSPYSESFSDFESALKFSKRQKYPQVIKADGLAAGKGVVIAKNFEEVETALHQILEEKIFGASGSQIVFQEFMEGQEASIEIVTDGQTYQFFPVAQDHKRIGDGDTGLNTGGMGAYAPVNHLVDDKMKQVICDTILTPLFEGLKKEGIDYRGILYAGIMITKEGPKVFEFNVRFGDPEAQVIMPLLKTPLIEIVEAVQDQRLDQLTLEFEEDLSVIGIVMAAANYPGEPKTGDLIEGSESKDLECVTVFHAATQEKNGKIVTNGGRVLTVTAWSENLEEARKLAYERVDQIHFKGAQFRRDIASAALKCDSKEA